MKIMNIIENKLGSMLIKDTPALSIKSKGLVVRYLPWINLVLGLIMLLSAESFRRWADTSINVTNYANSLGAIYGGPVPSLTHFSIAIWLGLISLVVMALLFLAAWRDTSFQKVSGWYFMFYALLIAVFYSVVILYTNYGISHTVFSLFGAIIGLYTLFQIRSSYIR